MDNEVTLFRKTLEIAKSTLLALAISLVFLWCAVFDRSYGELGATLSNMAIVLLPSIVFIHGIIFAVISRIYNQPDGLMEEKGTVNPPFLEMMAKMDLYLLIWFLILLGLWIYETLIIQAGIDIVRLFTCLVVLHSTAEAVFCIPFIGTLTILRVLRGRFRLISGSVYVALSGASLFVLIIWLSCNDLFQILINFLETVAVTGIVLSIFQLWREIRNDKVLFNENKSLSSDRNENCLERK